MKLAVVVFFIFNGLAASSQKLVFQAKDTIKGNYSQFSVDNFGRIYLIKNDVIINFSNKYDTLFSTSLKAFRPSSIESSKSFRALVFDQERSVLHFLDNTLTDIHGEIDLVNLDIQQPVLVCESFGGNTIWVLDAGSMRLIKLNENLEKVLITENLVSVFSNTNVPSQMLESNDRLFVLIPEKGVALFDVFGTFIRLIPCSAQSFDVHNNYLILKKEKTIEAISYQLDDSPNQTFQIPSGTVQFKFSSQMVYFLTDVGLIIGNYVNPQNR